MSKIEKYRQEIIEELTVAGRARDVPKDIIVVAHDQPECVKACLTSVLENTQSFRLFVHDNASEDETRHYLEGLGDRIFSLSRSETNEGFVLPNNRLAAKTTSPYVILLNSDTEVLPGWDRALTGFLNEHPDVTEVGYQGSLVDHEGKGGTPAFGYDIDFLCGFCVCVRNDFAGKIFDEDNLEFAYGEDSDLSFRIREGGGKIYSLHLDLVLHHGGKTTHAVEKEMGEEFRRIFEKNHQYIRRRWSRFLPKPPG